MDTSSYDNVSRKICKKNIRNESMHILRHTFTARCIEGGMKPKTLQKILGHAVVSMTMDLYVHLLGELKEKKIKMIEASLKII